MPSNDAVHWEPIYRRTLTVRDDFSGRDVSLEGFSYKGDPGLYDSYISALAAQSGHWDDYCWFHCCRAYEARHA